MFRQIIRWGLVMCAALTAGGGYAAVSPKMTALKVIQKQWAVCQYQTPDDDQQEDCFTRVIARTSQALNTLPGNPELTVWLAINKASLAGAHGGIGAISIAREAKTLLETVIKTAPKTLHGSAYTSLGLLYYKVPGWPLGFGDDAKAEQLLKKALVINPNGIDPNYFYGVFLLEDGRKAEAKIYLTRALHAPPRPDRPLADQGRKREIQAALGRLD